MAECWQIWCRGQQKSVLGIQVLKVYSWADMAKQFEEMLQDVTTNQTTQLRQNS